MLGFSDRQINPLRKTLYIPAVNFAAFQQKSVTPAGTIATTAGTQKAAYSMADIKGASLYTAATHDNVDQAAINTNGALYASAQLVSDVVTASGVFTLGTAPDFARNVAIGVTNDSGGNLNLYEGGTVYRVVGTDINGDALTEDITHTSTAGNKAVVTAKYRWVAGAKAFKTITSITMQDFGTKAPAATLKLTAGPGTIIALPRTLKTPAEADVLQATVTAAAYSVSGKVSTANNTVNIGAVADAADFAFVYNTADAGATAALTGTAIAAESIIISAGVNFGGSSVPAEVNSLGMMGVLMVTAADDIRTFLRLPMEVNTNHAINFRVHWTSGSATTADTITWKVFADIIAAGGTFAAPTSVLDTAIAQDTVTGAWANEWTEWGVLNGGTTTTTILENGAVLALIVELDAFAVGLSESKYILGLEIEYTPRITARTGGGMIYAAERRVTAA